MPPGVSVCPRTWRPFGSQHVSGLPSATGGSAGGLSKSSCPRQPWAHKPQVIESGIQGFPRAPCRVSRESQAALCPGP